MARNRAAQQVEANASGREPWLAAVGRFVRVALKPLFSGHPKTDVAKAETTQKAKQTKR